MEERIVIAGFTGGQGVMGFRPALTFAGMTENKTHLGYLPMVQK